MSSRLAYIDILKGFAIFLVVLGHILQQLYTDNNLVFRCIYSFHMPLFMFMSGYVYYKKNEWGLITKSAKQLLIPFLSFIIVIYLFYKIIYHIHIGLYDFFVSVILRPDIGLWFLWALFFIRIIFILVRKLATLINLNEYILLSIIAVVMNGVVYLFSIKILGIHWIAWYLVFFLLGVYWRNKDKLINYSKKPYKRILLVSAIMFPLMVVFFRMHNQPPMFYKWINLGPVFIIIYRLAIAFVGIALVVSFFRIIKLNSFFISQFIEWGKYTLGIYYIQFIINDILFLIPIERTKIYCLSMTIIYTIVSIYVSYWLTILSEKNCISRLLIIGK